MFRRMLSGDVVGWYWGLPICNIHIVEELEKAFKVAFANKVKRKKLKNTSLCINQRDQESTRDYMDSFETTI